MGTKKRTPRKKKPLPSDFEEQVIENLIKMRKLQREALIKIMGSMDLKIDRDKTQTK